MENQIGIQIPARNTLDGSVGVDRRMLLLPAFPKQIEERVVQKENRVVGRCRIGHVAADPAMHRIVQHAFRNALKA